MEINILEDIESLKQYIQDMNNTYKPFRNGVDNSESDFLAQAITMRMSKYDSRLVRLQLYIQTIIAGGE